MSSPSSSSPMQSSPLVAATPTPSPAPAPAATTIAPTTPTITSGATTSSATPPPSSSSSSSSAPSDKPKRAVGDYYIYNKIGYGSFASVWRGAHKKTGKLVAIKSINREKINLSKKHQDNLEMEISIMKKLKHPNIVQLYDVISSDRHIYLVLEYCSGGDLSKFIKRHGNTNENVLKYFMVQLADGLQFLRSNNLIHRDLKPQNLLLSSADSKPLLKIADFGFARDLAPDTLALTICGSPLYMAPEILSNQTYDAGADLWSTGAILYEMAYGRTPYTGHSYPQLLNNIRTQDLKIPEGPSKGLRSLLTALLKKNPNERIKFDDFFKHPFMLEAMAQMKKGAVIDEPLVNAPNTPSLPTPTSSAANTSSPASAAVIPPPQTPPAVTAPFNAAFTSPQQPQTQPNIVSAPATPIMPHATLQLQSPPTHSSQQLSPAVLPSQPTIASPLSSLPAAVPLPSHFPTPHGPRIVEKPIVASPFAIQSEMQGALQRNIDYSSPFAAPISPHSHSLAHNAPSPSPPPPESSSYVLISQSTSRDSAQDLTQQQQHQSPLHSPHRNAQHKFDGFSHAHSMALLQEQVKRTQLLVQISDAKIRDYSGDDVDDDEDFPSLDHTCFPLEYGHTPLQILVSAFTLYIKSLRIVSDLIEQVDEIVREFSSVPLRNNNASDCNVSEWQIKLNELQSFYTNVLSKSTRCQALIIADSKPSSAASSVDGGDGAFNVPRNVITPTADKVMFDFAVEYARIACLAEADNDYVSAANKYTQSLSLLQQLEQDAHREARDLDVQRIQIFMSKLQQRIQSVETKKQEKSA